MNKNKKLYRSNKNRMLLGVCGGLAEYFEIDPTVVRVLCVLITCIGGSGVLAYLVCALIMPIENE